MGPDTGIMKLFEGEKLGKALICRKCYNDLLDSIPNGVKNTESKGVWEAIIEFIHLKIKQDHLSNDS